MNMYPDLSYVFSLILLFLTLVCAFAWYYKKYIGIYSKFPTFSCVRIVLRDIFMSEMPKHIPATSFYFQKLLANIKEFQKEGYCLVWLVEPFLFIVNEEAMKVFSNERSALNKPHIYETLFPAFGTGLIVSNEEIWKKRRKMFNPHFSMFALKGNVPDLNKNAAILAKKLMEMPNKDSVELIEDLKFCTLSNMCDAFIGIDVNDPKRYDEIQQFIHSVTGACNLVVYRLFHPWLHPKYMLRFSSKGREYMKEVVVMRRFARKILLEFKESALSAEIKQEMSEIEPRRRTLVQLLLDYHLKDPSFTLEDMIDELITFITAGYETASYSLTWSLFLLGHHPEVQEQLHDELEIVMRNEISYDDLDKLTYLECVVKESLRLYPTAPMYGKRLTKDVQSGKYTVPKGTNVMFIPLLSQRDPKIYPDPEKFDPERFLKGNSDLKPWTYVPFAEGVRSCIGKKFALMGMKIILAHIIKNFKVTSLVRREDINLSWNIVLKPVEPLYMRLTPRQQTLDRG